MKKKDFNFLVIIVVAVILIGSFFYVSYNENKKIEKGKEIKTEKKSLKIGYLTDLHCYAKYDKDESNWELNWRCTQPLNNFTEKMNNEFRPDFVIEGGDFIDGRDKREADTFVEAKKIYDNLKVPHYHVAGNHETRGFTKDFWLEMTGYEKPYYYFDIDGYRMIVLDGNYKTDLEGNELRTSPDNKSYPGLINQEQFLWLENLLRNSESYEKLVFVHQPPVESTTIKPPSVLFTNGAEIRSLFSDYQVKAVFSGHIEEMCYLEYGGVEYYVLPGTHKDNRQLPEAYQFKDKGIFYEINVNEEGEIDVEMFHKEKEDEEYQIMKVDKNTAICNNNSVLKPEEYQNVSDQVEEDD